jgi:hypothetical protein
MAKTLKNLGADFCSTKAPRPSSLGRGSTNSSDVSLTSSGFSGSSGSAKLKEDCCLFIPIEKIALLNRPKPFAL